jgi:type II secretory pathway component PulF
MLNRRAQINLITAMFRLAKAGLSLHQIAQHISDFGTPAQQMIALDCLATMEEGKGFSAGLKGHIDDLAYESVSAGEFAGRMLDGFNNAIETLQMQLSSGIGLLMALLKPITGLVLLLFFIAFLGKTAIPALLDMIPKHQQRGASLLLQLQDAGIAIDVYLLPVVIIAVVILIASILSLPYLTGVKRQYLDVLPVYSEYRLIQAGNFLGAMSNIIRSGIKLRDALEQLQLTATPYMAWHINKMLQALQHEKNIGVILDTGLLNTPEISAISLLGEAGEHSITLQRSADMHRDILRAKTEFLREYGASAIKVLAYIIGFICAGALASFIFTLVNF